MLSQVDDLWCNRCSLTRTHTIFLVVLFYSASVPPPPLILSITFPRLLPASVYPSPIRADMRDVRMYVCVHACVCVNACSQLEVAVGRDVFGEMEDAVQASFRKLSL